MSYGGDAVGLTAHSVVRGPDGRLFDITPFGDRSARPYVRFIPHAGDDLSFFEIKARGHSFTCPPDLMANVSLEDWRPFDDDDANPGGEYFDDLLDRDR